jgi:hypothetical protein
MALAEATPFARSSEPASARAHPALMMANRRARDATPHRKGGLVLPRIRRLAVTRS